LCPEKTRETEEKEKEGKKINLIPLNFCFSGGVVAPISRDARNPYIRFF
jgi:hypothetical protein